MLIERSFRGRSAPVKIPAAAASFLKWGYTMLAVTLGWVLFKIEDLPEAVSYIKAMFGIGLGDYTAFSVRFFLNPRLGFFLAVACLACVPWAQVLPQKPGSYIAQFTESDKTAFRITRHVCLIALLVISFIFIVPYSLLFPSPISDGILFLIGKCDTLFQKELKRCLHFTMLSAIRQALMQPNS